MALLRIASVMFVILGLGVGLAPPALAQSDSASADSPLLVIDAGGHTGWTNRVIYWPYKNELITVSHDKSIRFWDLATGETTRVLRPPIDRGNAGRLHAASLAPNGKYLAVGGESALRKANDQAVYLIDPIDGRIVKSFGGHPSAIRCVVFSPNSQWLATSCYDEKIRLFEIETGKLRFLLGHGDSIVDLAFSPDGRSLVSGSWDKSARIWDFASGQARAVLPHGKSVLAVAWSPDGKTIATGGTDKSVRLWNPNGALHQIWPAIPEHIEFINYSPDSTRIVLAWGSRLSSHHGSAVFETSTGKELGRYSSSRHNDLDGLFLPDGNTVATVGFGGELALWDGKTGTVLKKMAARGGAVSGVGWSRDDCTIGWAHHCGGNSSLKGECALTHAFNLGQLDFAAPPDRSFQQAIGQANGYEIQRTKERIATVWFNGGVLSQYQLPHADSKVRARTLLSGRRAAVGCDFGLYVFDTHTGQGIYTLPGHFDAVLSLAPSVSQRYLLSGSIDHTLEIWNTDSYEHLVSLYFAGNEWIAWTPQGYYACSVGGESLMGWQVNQGPDQLALYFPASRFHSTHYRPDVVRRVLDSRSVKQAIVKANESRATTEPPLTIALAPPPEVRIVAPLPDATPVSSPLKFTAHVRSRSDEPISALQVLVHGRPFQERLAADLPVANRHDFTAEFELSLPPGKHQIALRAETARTYDLSQPLDVAVAGDALDNHPALYILAIGADPTVGNSPETNHFSKDAVLVAKALQENADRRYVQVHVKTLTANEATLSGIQNGFDWLKRETTTLDAAVVYFGGQAAQDAAGNAWIVPSNGAISGEKLSAAEIRSRLAPIRARLMLWTDWRKSAEVDRQPHSAGCIGLEIDVVSSGAAIDDLLRDLVDSKQGVAVIGANSGTASHHAAPHPNGIGWFAQAMDEGLAGKANLDGASGVTLTELEEYIKRRMSELSNQRWRPTIGRSPLIPVIPLAR